MSSAVRRCAIYTRKSSDDGLVRHDNQDASAARIKMRIVRVGRRHETDLA